jgi:hypothetical protein
VRGYSDHRRLRAVTMHYGLDLSRTKTLNCGWRHSRLIRHFANIGPDADLPLAVNVLARVPGLPFAEGLGYLTPPHRSWHRLPGT